MKPARRQAAAAGRISTRNSACASTTATTCCCRATAPPRRTSRKSARRTNSASCDQAIFPFMDLKTGERWTVRPNNGRIPWWVFSAGRRVPETRLSDYLAHGADRPHSGRYRRWPTACGAAACTGGCWSRSPSPPSTPPPREGLARLLAAVMRETLLRGGQACRPMLPKQGLSEALIDPAIATLRARGADIRLNSRIADLTIEGGRITGAAGPGGTDRGRSGRCGRARGSALGRRRPAARAGRAGRVRGHPEHPFPSCRPIPTGRSGKPDSSA